jgi:hypothetical protein
MKRMVIALLAVLIFLPIAKAGSTAGPTYKVTASTSPCVFDQFGGTDSCGPKINLTATFTTTMETGTFGDLSQDFSFYGTEPVVTGITGTLNGHSVSFVPSTSLFMGGMTGWILDGDAEGIGLSANGSIYGIEYDGFTQIWGPSGDSWVNWNVKDISPTPEPSTWMLFLIAITLMLILRFRKFAAMPTWPYSSVERRCTSK